MFLFFWDLLNCLNLLDLFDRLKAFGIVWAFWDILHDLGSFRIVWIVWEFFNFWDCSGCFSGSYGIV